MASSAARAGAKPDAPPAALDLLDLGKHDVGLVTSYFDLLRHEPDAVHCKACGQVLQIPNAED